MNWRSHVWLQMMMNPNLDPKFLMNVNRSIDQPSEFDMILSNMVGTKRFLPGMWSSGHRQYNHDLMTGMLKGMQFGGAKGMEAVLYHYFGDIISDQMVKSVGSDYRDAFMSMILGMNKVPRYSFED